MIGKIKVYCLKFADDVIVVADLAVGLRKMLRELKKFGREKKLMSKKQR